MDLKQLIEARKYVYKPEEDEEHNATDFYKGYSKGWQDAYDDLMIFLKENPDLLKADVEVRRFVR